MCGSKSNKKKRSLLQLSEVVGQLHAKTILPNGITKNNTKDIYINSKLWVKVCFVTSQALNNMYFNP